MASRYLSSVLLCGLLAVGCGDDHPSAARAPDASTAHASQSDAAARDAALEASAPDARVGVSYAHDVKPIFERCVICHFSTGVIDLDLTQPFDPQRGLILRKNSWAQEHQSPFEFVVQPGDPDRSFLIYKVAQDPATFDVANNGDPMPRQIPRVTDTELADIKQWISDGAKDDAFFNSNVATVLGSQVTLGKKQGKCTLCHYPGSPTGLEILSVFDPDKGLVGAKSLFSKKLRVAPGTPEDSFLIEKSRASAAERGPADAAALRTLEHGGGRHATRVDQSGREGRLGCWVMTWWIGVRAPSRSTSGARASAISYR
jgi:hypothetical protein